MHGNWSRFAVGLTTLTLTLLLSSIDAYSGNKKPLTFAPNMAAEVIDNAATEAGIHTVDSESCMLAVTSFGASNGKRASMASAYFATAADANRYFGWRLGQDVSEIKLQGQSTYRDKPVGRRAVMLLKSGLWQVMWTNGGTFRYFQSSDLAVALQLEKLDKDRASSTK